MLLLGVAAPVPTDTLLAAADQLVAAAPLERRGTWASLLAWEAASYAVLGWLAAVVRVGRGDMAPTLRTLIERLDSGPPVGPWASEAPEVGSQALGDILELWDAQQATGADGAIRPVET